MYPLSEENKLKGGSFLHSPPKLVTEEQVPYPIFKTDGEQHEMNRI